MSFSIKARPGLAARSWLLAVSVLAGASGSLGAQDPGPDEKVLLEQVIRAAVERVAPGVVTIETFGGARPFLGDPRALGGRPQDRERDERLGPIRMPGFQQAQGATTGLVVGADGWILTSRFNIQFEPSTVLVTLADGRKFAAQVAGQDVGRGLALLKVDAEDLAVPEVVDPSEAQVGQWVMALGRTFGSSGHPSVHLGIVSATDRLNGRAIQTDAYASPANYGGPLVDLAGRVLGLLTPLSPDGRAASADWYDSGIGFAATWVHLEDYLETLKSGRRVGVGFLGVSLDPGFLGPGARVGAVVADSPAAGAGLKSGDLILEVDGTEVRQGFHLQDTLARRNAGDLVSLKLRRPPAPEKDPEKDEEEEEAPAPREAPQPRGRRRFDPEAEKPTVVPEGGEIIQVTVLLAERPRADLEPKPPEEIPGPGEPDR